MSATSSLLWFDVEKRYKTMHHDEVRPGARLWFDVEKRYKTIAAQPPAMLPWLWFDVEKRYKTIRIVSIVHSLRCGLM